MNVPLNQEQTLQFVLTDPEAATELESRIEDLEAQLKQNSRNSSRPPLK